MPLLGNKFTLLGSHPIEDCISNKAMALLVNVTVARDKNPLSSVVPCPISQVQKVDSHAAHVTGQRGKFPLPHRG